MLSIVKSSVPDPVPFLPIRSWKNRIRIRVTQKSWIWTQIPHVSEIILPLQVDYSPFYLRLSSTVSKTNFPYKYDNPTRKADIGSCPIFTASRSSSTTLVGSDGEMHNYTSCKTSKFQVIRFKDFLYFQQFSPNCYSYKVLQFQSF